MISYAPLFRTMKEKNITSYKLEKLGFSRATYYSIRSGNSVSTNTRVGKLEFKNSHYDRKYIS